MQEQSLKNLVESTIENYNLYHGTTICKLSESDSVDVSFDMPSSTVLCGDYVAIYADRLLTRFFFSIPSLKYIHACSMYSISCHYYHNVFMMGDDKYKLNYLSFSHLGGKHSITIVTNTKNRTISTYDSIAIILMQKDVYTEIHSNISKQSIEHIHANKETIDRLITHSVFFYDSIRIVKTNLYQGPCSFPNYNTLVFSDKNIKVISSL